MMVLLWIHGNEEAGCCCTTRALASPETTQHTAIRPDSPTLVRTSLKIYKCAISGDYCAARLPFPKLRERIKVPDAVKRVPC
jgi:hypothetical protein